MLKRIIRLIYILLGATVGFYYLPLLWDVFNWQLDRSLLFFMDVAIGAIIFWLLSLALMKPTLNVIHQVEHDLTSKSPIYIFFGALLTILGLVLAVLISIPLWRTRIPVINNVLPILLMIVFSYYGFKIGTSRLDDWKNLATLRRNKDAGGQHEVIKQQDANYHHYKILDTNILIDGRIYDLVKTGFLEGTLLVPNFVLYELQYIADSGESIKRVRGRRGLDILNKLRKEKIVPIEMYDGDFEDVPEGQRGDRH